MVGEPGPSEVGVRAAEHVSRRRLLGTAGAALGGVGIVALTRTASAEAAAPPTQFEVRAYGAVGDGTTDDSTAIQNAINAARAAGGGVVAFHAGVFVVSRPLILYTNVTLRGAGVRATVLRKSASGGSFALVRSENFASLTGTDSTAGVTNTSLQTIGLDGNVSAGAGGNGVEIYGYGHIFLNVTVFNCAGRGIWSEYRGASQETNAIEAMLVDVKVHNCQGGGIYWNGPHDSQWVNVLVHSCGPPGATSGSTTKGVEAGPKSSGLRVSNGHIWGLNHGWAWYLDTEAPGLVNCTGEGASIAQVVLIGNDGQIVGGKYFGARDDRQTVGIEIGAADRPGTAGSFVNTKVIDCDLGSLKFTNDNGVGRYTVSAWQRTGTMVVFSPGAVQRTTNRLDLQVSGGATYGDLGTLKPFSYRDDVLLRGTLQVGRSDTKLGLFGADPAPRSNGWSADAVTDDRSLGATADATEIRNVLGTLILELKKYGLLG